MPAPVVWKSEYRINTILPNNDEQPVVAALANGGFAVSWYSDNINPNDEAVRATIRRADGTAINAFYGDFLIAGGADFESVGSVSALPDGRIVFSWAELSVNDEYDIYAEVRNSDGSTFADRFAITQPSTAAIDDQDSPTVLGLSNGNFMVGYRDAIPATDTMRVRSYDITGGLVGGNTISSTGFFEGAPNYPQLAELANGNVVVTWTSGPAGSPQLVFSIRSPTGLEVVGETDVNPEDSSLERISGEVIVLPDGNFVVLFERLFDPNRLQGRLFSQEGVALGERFEISVGAGNFPAGAALHDGRFMVAYQVAGTIVGRVMFADGTPDGMSFVIGTGTGPSIATLADGRVVVTWSSSELGNPDIFAEIYDPREAGLISAASALADDWVGTAFADQILMGLGNDSVVGGAGADSLYGEGGGDTLGGDAGNDLVFGGNGRDFANGGAGADLLYGGVGNDQLSGGTEGDNLWGGTGADEHIGGDGAGLDYARYDDGNHGNLVIRLDNAALNTGAAAGDGYVGIEGLVGGAGNDTVAGNGDRNFLFGSAGADFIYGGGGNDQLSGDAGGDNLWGGIGADLHIGGDGAGVDYARYDDANHGNLTIRLDAPAANAGAAAVGDTYTGIEGLVGGAGNDVVIGNGLGNFLFGSGGNDFIDGLGGNDHLNGGAGADRFRFSASIGAGNIDTIADFQAGVDDILLTQAIFAAIGASLTADEFRIGAAADANDFLLYNTTTGALTYDSNGNVGGGATVVATLGTGLALTVADFVMV